MLNQKKVVSMTNNNGEIGMSGPYVIDAKPHGHGDVHALMHSSGTAAEWMDAGALLVTHHILSHILSHVFNNSTTLPNTPHLSAITHHLTPPPLSPSPFHYQHTL